MSAGSGSFCQVTPPPGGSKRALFFFLRCSFLREKQIHIPPTRISWVSDFSSAFRSCVAHCLGRQELPGRGPRGLSHPAPPQCLGGAEPATRPDQLPRPGCLIPGRDPGPLTGQPTKAWIVHPCLWGCCDVWARLGPRPVGATVHLRLLPAATQRGTPVPTWTPAQCLLWAAGVTGRRRWVGRGLDHQAAVPAEGPQTSLPGGGSRGRGASRLSAGAVRGGPRLAHVQRPPWPAPAVQPPRTAHRGPFSLQPMGPAHTNSTAGRPLPPAPWPTPRGMRRTAW